MTSLGCLPSTVMGVVHGSQAFVRQRRELTGGGGVLLNITSGAALVGQPGRAAYSASKAAVDRLSEALAAEEADAGIRVPAVAPGVVDTTMQETIRGVDERVWPDRERFVHLHRQGKLTSPGHVADWLAAIAFDPSTGRPRSSRESPTSTLDERRSDLGDRDVV
jgi:NAD(P)-dependent dehydrogenase (short-subunit alcohol dehydrogenase family)